MKILLTKICRKSTDGHKKKGNGRMLERKKNKRVEKVMDKA